MASRRIGDKLTSVTASLQYTRNLGNFENVRVGFEITDDVRDGEKTSEAAKRVYAWVESLVDEKIREIDADARS